MESIRLLSFRLALCCLNALLLSLWLGLAPRVHWALTAASALALLASVLWAVKLAVLWRRAMLWRRRRNVRPSREIQTERRRISADLHDSIGSQLVQMQLALKGEAVSVSSIHYAQNTLEQTLLDLRLIVDSMDSMNDPLDLRLARLRHRFQPVLEQRGIELNWGLQALEGGDLPDLPRGTQANEITSIVQEAMSNALQHSQASCIWLALQPLAPNLSWKLSIEDDGIGIVQVQNKPQSSGLGLINMRRRAALAGVSFSIEPRDEGGTRVQLRW